MPKYLLEVVQQPVQAHMSGFGDKRRSIDPPPIVKLTLLDDRGQAMQSNPVDLTFFSIHVDLWSRIKVISLDAPHHVRNLLGSLISSAYYLSDTNGKAGIFFIFPDLSVRTEGRFTLRFSFIDLSQNSSNSSSLVLARIFSSPFTVYSAKNFPGGCEPTKLTKQFIKQGIRVPTRRTLLKPSLLEDEEQG
ncbi:hypothetical protein K493DRAFT_314173 [Basidiobolus meristosporus CBS 931.73]|uniref:Velvet domain-containing protein n=1 Tax=Basidiobolus meristosporus CBS 931.73 TaxID=1314790 RepID=A0A1Y1YGU3_9FUNG|nr:hypothetical protein K493DRAFT_314173 [Basidiobolus meristosporus CBS 931.73]|eukprot:ORX97199.1 hypothetical protein K493DRAFT_314173 [Basidiobolus meristosporus CBS 931.73]